MRLRRLSEMGVARSRGFSAGAGAVRALRDDPDPRLAQFFSTDAPLYVARAPGRLDVMGGIADYSGALVLQLPLARVDDRDPAATGGDARATSCRIAPAALGFVQRSSSTALVDGALRDPTALAAWFADASDDRWAAYVVGVVQHCLQRAPDARRRAMPRLQIAHRVRRAGGKGRQLVGGARGRDDGRGRGRATASTSRASEIATACQWVENHVVGAPCGIMDQMTSACGRRDRLLRLRCQPAPIEGHVAIPPGFRFYGIDSGLRHAVTGADYGTVRTAAFMGYRIIADDRRTCRRRMHDEHARHRRSALARLSGEHLAARIRGAIRASAAGADDRRGVSDALRRHHGHGDARRPRRDSIRFVRRRRIRSTSRRASSVSPSCSASCRDESRRARRSWAQLMYASHASYGACGLGSDGTDRLVDLVARAGSARGVFGAKITGGGSGGTVAVLGTDAAESEVRSIAAVVRGGDGSRGGGVWAVGTRASDCH